MFTEFTSGLTTLGFIFGNANPWELMILGMIALLLFGKRLPEVAKSLGKGIVEFKKDWPAWKTRSAAAKLQLLQQPLHQRPPPEAIDEEPIVSAPSSNPRSRNRSSPARAANKPDSL